MTAIDIRRLAHPPDAALVPLAEPHRTALRAACAEDRAIWPIYSVSFDPDHFDGQFDRMLADPALMAFAIMDGGALAGMTSYLNLKPAFQTVEIGNTYLRPAVRGTGLNRRIKHALIGHAFACGIRRVEFRIDDRNARSKAAVRGLGAVQDGLIRAERITWTGHVRDTALFSILAGEWQ